MNKIHCIDDHGRSVSVPSKSVTFRPAIYGILIEGDKVFLAQNDVTGLLHPPGRMLEDQETPSRALVHHFRRATGKLPSIGPLLLVEERYRVDQQGRAWHLSVLYYALDMQMLGSPVQFSAEEVDQLRLTSLDDLQRSQLQFGYEAVQAGRLRLELI